MYVIYYQSENYSNIYLRGIIHYGIQTYKLNVRYFDNIDIEQAMENIELYIDIDSEKQTDV